MLMTLETTTFATCLDRPRAQRRARSAADPLRRQLAARASRGSAKLAASQSRWPSSWASMNEVMFGRHARRKVEATDARLDQCFCGRNHLPVADPTRQVLLVRSGEFYRGGFFVVAANRKSRNSKEESGGPYRTRTYNQLIKSQLLYQLS